MLLGELFQNNHHHAKHDANFAKKWFEFDLTYQVMRVFNLIGIIRLNKVA
jgi:stearoyl-CoA desaturase (delta-9 desaturase)